MTDQHCAMTTKTCNKPGTDHAKEKEKEIFNKARNLINPVSKFVANFYSERKLLVFMMLYCSALLVVFGHFALTTGNNNFYRPSLYPGTITSWKYWFITRFPMIEAGGVNACLMMYALLPLTMAKFTISKLGDSFLGNFIPFRRLLRVHIFFAWTIMLFFTWLLIFFVPMIFTIKGLIGSIPPQLKFNNHMFITGYMIYSCMLAIWISSALRHRIKWEIFYYIHQLALLLFVLLIAHTLGTFRAELNQCYPWVAPPFLYYICDRLSMRLFQKYSALMESVTLVNGTYSDDNTKAMILRIRRPVLYSFKSGQYAYLRLKSIDSTWHPFSIMSDPDSANLEFFVGVVGDKSSWTSQLYNILKTKNENDTVEFEVMGPYGNSLGRAEEYSHVMAIGSGTGFVPVLSLFKNHVARLLRLNPSDHCQRLAENYDRVATHQLALDQYNESFGAKLLRGLGLQKKQETITSQQIKNELDTAVAEDMTQSRLLKMKFLADSATRSFYGKVLLTLLPMLGVAAIGFTISFNTIPNPVNPTPWNFHQMRLTIMAVSVLVQFLYAIIALCYWSANSMGAFLDLLLILVSPFADWLWFLRILEDGHLLSTDLILYTMLMGYFVGRLWFAAVAPVASTSWRAASQIPGVTTLEGLSAVWIVRHADMVAQLWPDINGHYERLVHAWGQERVNQVCKIQIYVTDKDQRKMDALQADISDTAMYQAGCLHWGRPDLEQLVEDHTLDLVSTRQHTYSLLSYCGSVGMSSELQRIKVHLDLVKAISGNESHSMEFVSECQHGGMQKKNKGGIKSTGDHAKFETAAQVPDHVKVSQNVVAVGSETEEDLDMDDVRLSDRTFPPPTRRRGLSVRQTISFASVGDQQQDGESHV